MAVLPIGIGTLAAVTTALEFKMPKTFRSAAFGCWPMTGCDCALQALMPSCHEWSRFLFPPPPQRLNQEPPWPQQLGLPDFWMVPHVGHADLPVVGVTADIYMGTCDCQGDKER